MKTKKPNAELVWKQFEDLLAPRLRLCAVERAVYSHLLRHTRLEGKSRLHFSMRWLSRNLGLGHDSVRKALRRLVAKGVLKLLERSKAGHIVHVRLPEEIRGARLRNTEVCDLARLPRRASLEEINFLKTPALREAIHARESGACFYCLRRISGRRRCLDHVVPQALRECNSYRNLVSCCVECNTWKGERPAQDFLRWLYRQDRLTAVELTQRFRALKRLAAAKLRPVLPCPEPRKT